MIIKLKSDVTQVEVEGLMDRVNSLGLVASQTKGENYQIVVALGDSSKIDTNLIKAIPFVDEILRVQEPYKQVSRKFHPEDTIIELGNGTKIGGGNFLLIAGPCSVESEDQIIEVAKRVKAAGATVLRGGAYKPRTSPYSFQGMGVDGLDLLLKAKEATGLPIVSEIMEISQLKHFDEVDILQVGARNVQNFDLLKAVGATKKPILLKRGLSATYEELLMSAEYIMSEGNSQIILCERGIRTFETETRNTLDITAIPFLKGKTHLPVIIDPSHAAGIRDFVKPLSLAGVGAGVDGIMIEVHNNPSMALCDGPQSLEPDAFDQVAHEILGLRQAIAHL